MTPKDYEAEQLVGAVLGKRFEIVNCLEEDETGARYAAQDTSQGTTALVRVLHRLRPDDDSLRQLVKLLTEVSGLGIAGVAKLRGVGRTRSRNAYYATDAVTGQSLNQLMESHPPAPSDAVQLINGVAEILELAHGRGLVHGALHPGAVIVAGKGSSQKCHVLDFGLGSLLMAGDVWPAGQQGTTGLYQAPEQAKGEAFDHRADIYALGALLFYALTGSAPFEGQSPLEILACQLRGEAPSLGAVKPALEGSPLQALVDQCMHAEQGERFQSVGAFIRALANVGRQEASRVKGSPAKAPAAAATRPATKGAKGAKGGKGGKRTNGARPAAALPRSQRGTDSGRSNLLWYALGAIVLFGGLAFFGLSAMEGPDSSAEALAQTPAARPAPPEKVTAQKTPPASSAKRERLPFGGAQNAEQDGGVQNPNGGKAIEAAMAEKVPALSEQALGLIAEGNQALDEGQYSRAIARFRSAKRSAPDAPAVARGLGMAYLHAGQTDSAAREFQRYLKLSPNASDGMMVRHTLRQLGVID
jgi:serine/threonine-protein kinase